MACLELDFLPRDTFQQELNWHLITNCSVTGMITLQHLFFNHAVYWCALYWLGSDCYVHSIFSSFLKFIVYNANKLWGMSIWKPTFNGEIWCIFMLLLCIKSTIDMNTTAMMFSLVCAWKTSCETHKTGTPEIFLECYCVARKEPIRRGKTNLHTTVVKRFGACSNVPMLTAIGYDTINAQKISDFHNLISLTVMEALFSSFCEFAQKSGSSVSLWGWQLSWIHWWWKANSSEEHSWENHYSTN